MKHDGAGHREHKVKKLQSLPCGAQMQGRNQTRQQEINSRREVKGGERKQYSEEDWELERDVNLKRMFVLSHWQIRRKQPSKHQTHEQSST